MEKRVRVDEYREALKKRATPRPLRLTEPRIPIGFVRPDEAEILAEFVCRTYRRPLRQPLGRRVRQRVPDHAIDPVALRRQLVPDGPTRYLWLLSSSVPQGFAKLNITSAHPLKTNGAGRRMYERQGFAVVGEIPFLTDQPDVGMWVMKKESG